jgi:hypothetical protein
MTRTTNARVAGFTFFFYIAAGVSGMFLFAGATGGEGIAARLASIAQHATAVRVTVLLVLLQGFCALVLGVTLHAITREQDPDLAMLGLACRVVEGITGIFVARTLGLLWLATAELPNAGDAAATHLLGAFLFKMEGSDDPHAIGLARRAGVGRARRDPSPAARRIGRGLRHLVHGHVGTDAGVRGGAGAVAAHQRCRDTGADATGRRVMVQLTCP